MITLIVSIVNGKAVVSVKDIVELLQNHSVLDVLEALKNVEEVIANDNIRGKESEKPDLADVLADIFELSDEDRADIKKEFDRNEKIVKDTLMEGAKKFEEFLDLVFSDLGQVDDVDDSETKKTQEKQKTDKPENKNKS